MPEQASYDYAALRIVPRVEREEFVNAGVIVFCPERRFLAAHIHMDETRLKAIWPDIDVQLVRDHLEASVKVCSGDPDGGPIAALSQRERFHWLVAPRSTVVQVSPVHTGLCDSPELALANICRQLFQ